MREFFSRHSEAEKSSQIRAKLAGDSLTLDEDRPSSAAAYTKIGQRVDASANPVSEPPKVEAVAQQSVVAPNFASQRAHANAVPASGPAQWTQSDIAALTSSDVQGLTASQLASLSPTQISWFSPAQVAAFSSAQLNGLSGPQVGALTASQVDALTPAQFSSLNASFVASLTYQQLNALTTAQTQSLSATQLQALSGTQVASIVNPLFAALSGAQFSSLSSPALQSLQAFQIASFSKAQISGLTSQAIALFTTSQINAFSPYQISLLNNAQTQALTTAQVQSLSAAATSGLTGAQLNALTTAQVQSLTATQLSALSGAQVASLVNPNFSALSGAQFSQLSTAALQSLQPFQIVSLSGAQIAGLTPSSVASFTPSQINAFSSYAISLFSNAQIQALTTSQIQGLSASSVSGLTGAQLNALTTTQVQALTATQLQAFSGAQASSLVNPNFAALTGAQFSQLSTTALQSLQSFQISSFSGVQISGLTPAAVAAFTPAQVSVFTPYALSLLNNAQTQALTSSQLNALNASQTNALLPSQLKVLTPQQVSGLSNAVIATFSGDQFDALSVSSLQALAPGQIRTLSGNQVSSLSVQTVASFTPSQYAALSSTALSALTPAQAQALSIGQLDALRGGLLPTTGPLQNLGNNASYLEVAPNFYAYTPNGAGVTGVGAFGPTLAAAEAFAGGGNNAYATPNGGEQYFIATDSNSPTGQIYGYTADNAGQTGRFAYGLSEDAAKQTFLSAFGAPPSSTQSGSLSDLSPAALASIAPSLLATLNPAELTGLSYAQLGSLTVAQLSALSSQQLAAVNSSILQSAGPVQGLGNNTAEVQYAANVVAFTSNGSGGTGIGAYGPDLATAEAYANQNIAYNAPNGSPEFVEAADASSPTGILYAYIGDGAGGIGNGAYGLSLASAKQAFLNAYGPGPGPSTGSFLSLDQIANLSVAQVAALAPSVIGNFTTQQLQALPHFEALAANQTAAISGPEGPYLSTTQLSGLSTDGVSGLSLDVIASLSATQVASIANVHGFTASQVGALLPEAAASLSPASIAKITTSAINGLSVADLKLFSSAQLGSVLSLVSFAKLDPTQASVLFRLAGGIVSDGGLISDSVIPSLTSDQAVAIGSASDGQSYISFVSDLILQNPALLPSAKKGFGLSREAIAISYQAVTTVADSQSAQPPTDPFSPGGHQEQPLPVLETVGGVTYNPTIDPASTGFTVSFGVDGAILHYDDGTTDVPSIDFIKGLSNYDASQLTANDIAKLSPGQVHALSEDQAISLSTDALNALALNPFAKVFLSSGAAAVVDTFSVGLARANIQQDSTPSKVFLNPVISYSDSNVKKALDILLSSETGKKLIADITNGDHPVQIVIGVPVTGPGAYTNNAAGSTHIDEVTGDITITLSPNQDPTSLTVTLLHELNHLQAFSVNPDLYNVERLYFNGSVKFGPNEYTYDNGAPNGLSLEETRAYYTTYQQILTDPKLKDLRAGFVAFLGGEATPINVTPAGSFDQYQAYLAQHGREPAIVDALALAGNTYESELVQRAIELANQKASAGKH